MSIAGRGSQLAQTAHQYFTLPLWNINITHTLWYTNLKDGDQIKNPWSIKYKPKFHEDIQNENKGKLFAEHLFVNLIWMGLPPISQHAMLELRT